MNPKRIRVTQPNSSHLTLGKVYDVVEFHRGSMPEILDDNGEEIILAESKWEPVQDFKHGDPVWAWDSDKGCKCVSVYVGVHPMNENAHVIYVPDKGITVYKHVEHRKPTITLKELAEKADIDLDEYEVVTK